MPAARFKRFALTKAALLAEVGDAAWRAASTPEPVRAQDVIDALLAYRAGGLTLDALLDWVNVLWFTELYAYEPAQEEAIASVMTVLETMDEPGNALTDAMFDGMLDALSQNHPYSPPGNTTRP